MDLKKPISITMSLLAGFSVALMSAASAADPAGKSLLDFDDASIVGQWQSVNDGVMGGVSEGNFRITNDDALLFFGNLSLENNGGFASIRTRPADLNLEGYDSTAVRIKGDGRTYYLNLRTSSRRAASYRAPVQTHRNTWLEIRVPLTNFVYTAYGRRVPAEPLRAEDIQSIGFTLADKQAGPFRLEISSIRAEKNLALMPPTANLTPRENAQTLIELAIRRGVPLFNGGQASACTAIYEVAIESLLKSPTDALSDRDRSTLGNALRQIRREDGNPSKQAWTLRHALDAVYASLASS